MGAQATVVRKVVCPRCRVKVGVDATRCPECGEPLTPPHKFPIYIGIVGVLMLLFMAVIFIVSVYSEDRAANAPIDPDSPPADSAPAPPAPEKPPPLNK